MIKKKAHSFFLGISLLLLFSCGGEILPKPKGMIRLAYPTPKYESTSLGCPYSFEKNEIADFQRARQNKECWYNLYYPQLKATIYVSYYPIDNNLNSLLKDAQNLTQEHFIKADAIKPDVYSDLEKKVYGILYEVSGDAASPSQFYLTDSINHFVSGSVYFKVRPNYDSILPAINYLRNDIKHFMETVRWEE